MRKYLFLILFLLCAIISANSLFISDKQNGDSCVNLSNASLFDDYSDYINEIENLGLSAENNYNHFTSLSFGNFSKCQFQKNHSNKFILDNLLSTVYKSLFLKRLDIKNYLLNSRPFLYFIRVLRN